MREHDTPILRFGANTRKMGAPRGIRTPDTWFRRTISLCQPVFASAGTCRLFQVSTPKMRGHRPSGAVRSTRVLPSSFASMVPKWCQNGPGSASAPFVRGSARLLIRRDDPCPCPRWRIASNQSGIVACPQRAAKPWVIESERLLGRLPDARQANDEQVIVDEDEALPPAVPTWIEQANGPPSNPMRDSLPLGRVAERAAPGEVPDMVRAWSPRRRPERRETPGQVVAPKRGRDDVIDLELPRGGKQAVLAGIASPESHGQSDYFIARVVSLVPIQFLQQSPQGWWPAHSAARTRRALARVATRRRCSGSASKPRHQASASSS